MILISSALALGLLVSPDALSLGATQTEQQDEDESYEELRARELEGLVERFKEHAEWCKKKKLWLQRALAYEAVLQFAPDDEEAHGYKKKVMRYCSTYRHTGVIGH